MTICKSPNGVFSMITTTLLLILKGRDFNDLKIRVAVITVKLRVTVSPHTKYTKYGCMHSF